MKKELRMSQIELKNRRLTIYKNIKELEGVGLLYPNTTIIFKDDLAIIDDVDYDIIELSNDISFLLNDRYIIDYDDDCYIINYDDDIKCEDDKNIFDDYKYHYSYIKRVDIDTRIDYYNDMIISDFWDYFNSEFLARFMDLFPKINDFYNISHYKGKVFYIDPKIEEVEDLNLVIYDDYNETIDDLFVTLYKKPIKTPDYTITDIEEFIQSEVNDLSISSYFANALDDDDLLSIKLMNEFKNDYEYDLNYFDFKDFFDYEGYEKAEYGYKDQNFLRRAIDAYFDHNFIIDDNNKIYHKDLDISIDRFRKLSRVAKKCNMFLGNDDLGFYLADIDETMNLTTITDDYKYHIDFDFYDNRAVLQIAKDNLDIRRINRDIRYKNNDELALLARKIFISFDDSLNSGNCDIGTKDFCNRHNIDITKIGALRGDYVLELDDFSYFVVNAIKHKLSAIEYLKTNKGQI